MNQYILKSGIFCVEPSYDEEDEDGYGKYEYLACKVEDEHGCERGMILKYREHYEALFDIDVDHIKNTKEDYEYLKDNKALDERDVKFVMKNVGDFSKTIKLVFEHERNI